MASSIIPSMPLAAIEVTTKGVMLEVRINDVPTLMVGEVGDGQAFMSVTAFAVLGSNRLVARARINEAGQKASAVEANIRVAIFSEGDHWFTNSGSELLRLKWSGGSNPTMLEGHFNCSFGPTAWAWEACQRWDNVTLATHDAMPFIQQFVQALAICDTTWIEAVSDPKFADMAIAFPAVSETEMRALNSKQLMETIPISPPQVSPSPQLCGGNRLLQLQAGGGQPLLRKKTTDGHEVSLSAIIGKLAGRWQIMR